MPVLQDERYQEVAQLIEVINDLQLAQHLGYYNALEGSGLSILQSSFIRNKFVYAWTKAFRDTGLDYEQFLDGDGANFGSNIFQLKALVRSGKVTTAEAQAFLQNKYGGLLQFSDGIFDKTAIPKAEGLAIDADQPTEAEDGHKTLTERAIEARQAIAEGGGGGGNFDFPAIYVDELPIEYERRQVQASIELLADQVQLSLAEVRAGRINFPNNSIPGTALKPGSIKFPKVNFSSFYEKLMTWPGPEDAIDLQISPDTTTDRWHDVGALDFKQAGGAQGLFSTVKGPGRVQKVTSSRFLSRAQRPRPGPTRYRIVQPGQRFGLVSICRVMEVNSLNTRAHDSKECLYEMTYGAVIRGLPNFLPHAPQFIKTVWNGDVPCGLVGMTTDPGAGGGALPELYHTKATEEFATNPPRMLEGYSLLLNSSNYEPPSGVLDDFAGFNVMLITGETSKQVYAQMNGRPNEYVHISGNPHGPMSATHDTRTQQTQHAKTPFYNEGLDYHRRAPAPPCIVESSDNVFTADNYVTEATGGLVTSSLSRRVATGVPFELADCERLKPTVGPDGNFSVYVEVNLRYRVAGGDSTINPSIAFWQNNPDNGMMPGAWWTQGARVVRQNNRKTAVDIVVW